MIETSHVRSSVYKEHEQPISAFGFERHEALGQYLAPWTDHFEQALTNGMDCEFFVYTRHRVDRERKERFDNVHYYWYREHW
jgi:hypothetical protein